MPNKPDSIKLMHSAIDETPAGDIIFRGVLDPNSLSLIRVDTYQREVLPLSMVASLVKAIKNQNPIPDIVIGMRGASYSERGDTAFLEDEVYVIDGLQRISVAMELMRRGEQMQPHIGATVRFNTTRESENELFTILNTKQAKLSASVLIRNLRESNAAISMLYDLCYDRSFAMAERVCWDQQMKRGQLITALGLVKISAELHATYGPGLASRWLESSEGINKIMGAIGRKTMRENVRTFFEVLDTSYGIRKVTQKVGYAHLKNTFLVALCRVFSNHRNFWDDNKKFSVNPETRRKLSTFPVNDVEIQRLASAGTTAVGILYFKMVEHLNKSKKFNRLVPFKESDGISMPARSQPARDRILRELQEGRPAPRTSQHEEEEEEETTHTHA